MTHNTWSQDLYVKAYRFAAPAHRGQTVPGTEWPYVMHLSLVSIEIVAALNVEKGHDEDFAIQCALLHDVIEDTEITYHQVQRAFGSAIADGVLALSKDETMATAQQSARPGVEIPLVIRCSQHCLAIGAVLPRAVAMRCLPMVW